LTDLDEIINQAKGTINAIVDEIIAHFPAIKNQLKKAVEEAFQDITDYAKNQWEQALEKAVKDLEDTLHSLIENLTEEIEKAVSPEDIAKLHTSLEGVSATLKATAEALIKKLPDAKGKIENLLQTTQKKIEEALKAKLDELGQVADEKLRELYRDSIGFLNGNALVAPTFTGNEAAPYCSTEKTYVFSTTGSKVLSGEVYGNDVEDVIGYLAILTDDEGKQQLFILPGSELKDFPIAINEAIKDYTLEIRTIGKDNILPVASATIYEKIKNLNLEQDWTALVADVKEGITDIQSILAKIETRLHDSDSKLLEKLQPIRTFLTEVASKVINSVPAEWSAPVIEALQTAQDGIEALPAALAVHLKVADALNQQFFDKAYEQWAPIDDNILHVSDGSVATFITTLQKIDKQEDFDERGVLPYKIGFSR
jgi:gas vesicle protein